MYITKSHSRKKDMLLHILYYFLPDCFKVKAIKTNTTTTRNGLSYDAEYIQSIGNGGLSGAPETNLSTEVIRYVHEKSHGAFPIIGVGGVMSPEDAYEKLEAGASLVQIYTGFIYEGPSLINKICKYIVKNTKK